MKILFNASNIKKSGALQVTLSILEELRNSCKHEFAVIVSSQVASKLDRKQFGVNFKFFDLDLVLPFQIKYSTFIKSISKIELSEKPDFVFSVFGPTYWKPKTKHLCGFANPWLINPDSSFIQSLSLKKRITLKLEKTIKTYFIKRESKFFVTETEDVKNRLNKYLKVPLDNIFVVSSTYNHFFTELYQNQLEKIDLGEKEDHSFRLLTISLNFPHKNLEIIAKVSQELKQRGYNKIYFYVTLPKTDYDILFKNSQNVINLGIVKGSNCPSLYRQCDALFLPTLLECFSATYPESMISRTPILTSNLGFAKSVCKDSALYFDPLNASDIADKILLLKNNEKLITELTNNGISIVEKLPDATKRANTYIEILEHLNITETNERKQDI